MSVSALLPESSRPKKAWYQLTFSPEHGVLLVLLGAVLTGAIALTALLYVVGWLSLFTALVFALALIKLAIITWQKDWYCTCRFEHIARFETYFALSYTALAALTVLPPKLPPV